MFFKENLEATERELDRLDETVPKQEDQAQPKVQPRTKWITKKSPESSPRVQESQQIAPTIITPKQNAANNSTTAAGQISTPPQQLRVTPPPNAAEQQAQPTSVSSQQLTVPSQGQGQPTDDKR